MAAAYTPGLQVTPRTLFRARRILPIEGEVLVNVGEAVDARQVIAEAQLPGDITPINLANQLSVAPSDVPGCVRSAEHEVGDLIEPGELLARSQGIFGLFKAEFHSRTGGTIESISHVTGQLILRGPAIPVSRRAYVTGTIVEVIPGQGAVVEASVSLIQGIFGIAGEAYGSVRMACDSPDQEFGPDCIDSSMSECVVIGGARMNGDTVRKAIEVGVSAVVSGGIDDADLREILGYDLGVAVTGSEQIGTTLIITEGFGDIAMARRTFELLKSREGSPAAVNGATQIRAGVLRPQIVIPLGDKADNGRPVTLSSEGGGLLLEGTPVRIIRDPYFGRLGTVASLPTEPRVLDSGSKARVLEVTCDSGERLTVPRANVEIIGDAG